MTLFRELKFKKMKSKIQKRSLWIVLGFFAWLTEASAQSYYPGGLGNSNLVVWLNAKKTGSITQNGSNQVSQWADLSGNGYNFIQGTTSEEPVYGAAASPSGMSALTFTSTSTQYLSTPSLPASIVFTAGVSAFAVASYNADQTAQGWQRIFDFGNGAASNNFMMGRDGNSQNTYYEGWKGGAGDQTWTTTNPIVNGSENIYEAIQQGAAAGTLTSVAHYLAGTAQAATGAVGSSQTWVPAAIARTSNYIGRSNWNADNYFSGTMSEILVYNTAFNTTQRVILENYVSAEWNQTVNVSKYSPPTATTYGTSLVGIGYTSTTDNFLADVAGSTDGLGFSSGSGATGFLNTTGYLMAAHNGQTNTIINNATVSGISNSSGTIGLWNRSWDVQKAGGNSTGLVTLNFNFNDYNGTAPNSTYTYALLYNATNGSFASGSNQLITTASTTVSGSTVSFVVNAANLSDGYYTLIWSTTGVLPVILTDFTATKQGGSSLLQWSTSMQTSISRFVIQRAADDSNCATIGMVADTGTGPTSGYYSFTDNQPATGVNNYRLEVVDQDGNSTWSAVRSVDFGTGGAATVTIYPNPVMDELHIVISHSTGVANILVVNVQGQVVRVVRSVSSNTIDIPVNGLASGIYFVKVNTDTIKYVQKVIKY